MTNISDRPFQTSFLGLAEPEPPIVRRSRVTNDITTRCNQSTASGRRLNDLLRDFLRQMGNPTTAGAQVMALEAAELVLMAEDARARLLAGNGDADQVVRLQNLAHRAVRKLGIDQQRNAKPKQSLADYARQKSVAPPADHPTKASAA
jgi:hypothetical protein